MFKNYDIDLLNELPSKELCLMPLRGTEDLTKKIDEYIVEWRKQSVSKIKSDVPSNYLKDTYIKYPQVVRFGSGEAKGMINDTVRGADIFLIVDVTNYSQTYKLYGIENHMSPDDHYQDLKRIIAATNGKSKRVNVIMPFLYESRQHKRTGRESLDCALMLQELHNMGVSNIITVDAHDPKIMNAIPLGSFDSILCYYQFIQTLLTEFPDIDISQDGLMMISPDTGAMQRTIYFANVLGIDMGTFYKRRDFTRVIDGKNPIIAHEFLGNSVEGKDVIIVDDMIASGDSMVDTARELKSRKAKRVFACCTFGLFTSGLEVFDKAHNEGLIDCVFTTNCIYQSKELLKKPWYRNVEVSEYLAKIIDCINHDSSISMYLDPIDKIHSFLSKYKNREL